ncbi:hypothetical protein QYE76_048918 [Lolium multiflorum]|uniref:Reverse transcriptase zinc-binding domain-containing protein n=1 Tax=Lolium multiflorum TaxID=4521 RepID=A0AAD8WFV0_LOLMU|nr:hypothetical protein QYE76_048918 [Lolium multiflorum]
MEMGEFERFKERAMEIVRNSKDPASCLRLMRRRAASILGAGELDRGKFSMGDSFKSRSCPLPEFPLLPEGAMETSGVGAHTGKRQLPAGTTEVVATAIVPTGARPAVTAIADPSSCDGNEQYSADGTAVAEDSGEADEAVGSNSDGQGAVQLHALAVSGFQQGVPYTYDNNRKGNRNVQEQPAQNKRRCRQYEVFWERASELPEIIAEAWEGMMDDAGVGATSSRPDGQRPVWKLIWQCKAPPKVRMFAWKLAKNALATQMNKKRRHMETMGTCPVCNQEDEDSFHAMIRCPHAKALWQIMHSCWDLPDVEMLFNSGPEWIFDVLLELNEVGILVFSSNLVARAWRCQIWSLMASPECCPGMILSTAMALPLASYIGASRRLVTITYLKLDVGLLEEPRGWRLARPATCYEDEVSLEPDEYDIELLAEAVMSLPARHVQRQKLITNVRSIIPTIAVDLNAAVRVHSVVSPSPR